MNQNKNGSAHPKTAQKKTVNKTVSHSNKQRKSNNSRYNGSTLSYVKSLCDPFEHSGCKLGWGTMLPTRINQAYIRGTTTANADGTLALAGIPDLLETCSIGSGGAAVPFSSGTTQAASDAAAIQANFTSGRIVSIGIRSYPVIAATAAPGIVYAGALQDLTFTQFLALTPNDLIAFPTSHMSIGSLGASSTGRPIDDTSFTFYDQIVNVSGWSAAVTTTGISVPFSIPYQVYSGLPASAIVAFEVVFNFEGIMKLVHGAAPMGMGEDTDKLGLLSTQWNSVEQLWAAISNRLPPPGRPFEWAAVIDGSEQATRNLPRGSVSMGFPTTTRFLTR